MLVTHAVDFLRLVDTIIVMKAGQIVMKGSYDQIKGSEYMQEIMSIHKSGISTDEELINTSI